MKQLLLLVSVSVLAGLVILVARRSRPQEPTGPAGTWEPAPMPSNT